MDIMLPLREVLLCFVGSLPSPVDRHAATLSALADSLHRVPAPMDLVTELALSLLGNGLSDDEADILGTRWLLAATACLAHRPDALEACAGLFAAALEQALSSPRAARGAASQWDQSHWDIQRSNDLPMDLQP